MDENEIKKLRHSFTSSSSNEISKIKKNQFGHTVLGDVRQIDTSDIHVEIAENGEIVANPSEWLLNSQKLQNMAKNMDKYSNSYEDLSQAEEFEVQTNIIEASNQFISKEVSIASLLSELDDMDGTSELKHLEVQTQDQWFMNCLNQDCMYSLPKDAKFCLKCGTAQLPKFCTECGFKFPGLEKFCPDCGNKR
jgi:hypothetical protein